MSRSQLASDPASNMFRLGIAIYAFFTSLCGALMLAIANASAYEASSGARFMMVMVTVTYGIIWSLCLVSFGMSPLAFMRLFVQHRWMGVVALLCTLCMALLLAPGLLSSRAASEVQTAEADKAGEATALAIQQGVRQTLPRSH